MQEKYKIFIKESKTSWNSSFREYITVLSLIALFWDISVNFSNFSITHDALRPHPFSFVWSLSRVPGFLHNKKLPEASRVVTEMLFFLRLHVAEMAVEVVESFRSDARLFSLSFLNVTWNLERNVSKRLGFRKTLLAPSICYIFSWKWAVSFVMRWEWHRRKLTCLVQRRRYCGWLTFGIVSFIYGKTRYVS